MIYVKILIDIAAVSVRITRLLLSTVHCATANKRFCLSVSFGFDGHARRVPLPLHSTFDIRLPTTNFRVFSVFRGSIHPFLHVLHDLHGQENKLSLSTNGRTK